MKLVNSVYSLRKCVLLYYHIQVITREMGWELINNYIQLKKPKLGHKFQSQDSFFISGFPSVGICLLVFLCN